MTDTRHPLHDMTDATTDPEIIARDRALITAAVDKLIAMNRDEIIEDVDASGEAGDIGGTLSEIAFGAPLEGDYDDFGAFWVSIADYMTRQIARLVVLDEQQSPETGVTDDDLMADLVKSVDLDGMREDDPDDPRLWAYVLLFGDECIECINRDMNGLAPIHDHTGGN